jgi:hypothetical protein
VRPLFLWSLKGFPSITTYSDCLVSHEVTFSNDLSAADTQVVPHKNMEERFMEEESTHWMNAVERLMEIQSCRPGGVS